MSEQNDVDKKQADSPRADESADNPYHPPALDTGGVTPKSKLISLYGIVAGLILSVPASFIAMFVVCGASMQFVPNASIYPTVITGLIVFAATMLFALSLARPKV